MGEAVADGARERRPRLRLRRVAQGFLRGPGRLPPGRGRHLHHAAEQAPVGSASQQHRAVPTRQPEGDPVAQRPRPPRRLAGQGFGDAARAARASLAPGAGEAAGPVRSADAGAEIHQRLRVVAGPLPGRECLGEGVEHGPCLRQRRLDGVQAGDHPLDVAVDDSRRPVVSDGGDRRRRVAADSRQRPQRLLARREPPAVLREDDAGAAVQVARPRVIAEALPSVEHLVGIGAGQRLEGGPARVEAREALADDRHRRLLEHDLAEPDDIGVRPHTGLGAPGQAAAMSVVPVEQGGGQARGRRCERGHGGGVRITSARAARVQ